MMFDPRRHEALNPTPWDAGHALAAIQAIVQDTVARYSEDLYWPVHPTDRQGGNDVREFETSLFDGACGVFWALDYLQAVGAASGGLSRPKNLDEMRARNRVLLGPAAERNKASYLLGDTPFHLLAYGAAPDAAVRAQLVDLIAGHTEHPARELMKGAPGTLLAAWFLHQHTGVPPWADLFCATADRLWAQLEWSDEHQCAFWRQQFDPLPSTYLDAVHGFVSVAVPLIHGRELLDPARWAEWQACIVNTVRRTADVEGPHVNWRPQLDRTPDAAKKLLQFCHGAPGFVICLADLPSPDLDDLLLAAGETTWAAGPLAKGPNLCHGTAGNAYAFLKLHARTGDTLWLDRARAFAMHAIGQSEAAAERHRQRHYSLWTGDLGLAVFLWDCIKGQTRFPTLDVFFERRAGL
jgi:hypothetical protein